jgi:hypothetical protein
MRIVILFLVALLFIQPVLGQVSSKKEMQGKMQEAVSEINKQIGELDKQIAKTESPEEVKNLQEQVAMLKKQLAMMQGLNTNISRMPAKVFTDAAEQESIIAPKKDVARINSLPKKALNDAEVFLFIKNVHAAVEKTIPAIEKTEALKIYSETKEKYHSVDVTG